MKIVHAWRNFIFFCITFLFSTFGYEFMFFVMTVHIYDLTQSVINVSIFTVINYLPKLFSPYLGLITDRFNKENIFSVVSVLIGLLVFILSFVPNILVIYVVWFFISVLLTLIVNTRSTLMADVISKERYSLGNTVTLVLSNSSRIIAPLIGGVIILLLDIKALLIFTAVIYLLTAIFSRFLELGNQSKTKANIVVNKNGTIRETLNYISQNRVILFLAILGCLWSLFLGFRVSVYVGYIEGVLESTKSYYGVFLTLIGIGSIIGSILGTALSRFIKHTNIMMVGLSTHLVAFSLLGIVNSINVALIVVCISHIGLYSAVVGMHTLRDKGTSSLVRGRVYGLVTAVLTPASIISTLIAGALSDIIGIRTLFFVAGILGLISLYLLILIAKPLKHLASKAI